MLSTTHARQSVASIGALIILLCMAFDQFMQQIIILNTTVKEIDSSQAKINQVRAFHMGDGHEYDNDAFDSI